MRQLISGLLFSCVLFSSELQDCQVAKAAVITARLGGTVILSWKRPARQQQYTVRNTEWKKDIFYISKSGGVKVVEDVTKDRTQNISSNNGLVSVVLHGVKWTDSGRYKCFRGSPERRPRDSINQCGLRLVVIDARDPYVGTTDTYDLFQNNGSVKLSCIFVTNATSEYPGDTSFIWRRNGAKFDSDMQVHTSVRHGESGSQLRVVTSTLTITSVVNTGDRFTCQARYGQGHLTGQSEEFAMNMDSWPDVYTNHVVLNEGDKATLTWTLPQFRSPFVVTSPSGAAILEVDSANIVITSPYRSRVKVAGVLTADDYAAVQLIVHSVMGCDAGRYSCETRDNGTLSEWDNFVHVLRKPSEPTISHVHERKGMTLSCVSVSRSLPYNNPEMLSYNWRRNTSEIGLKVFQRSEPTFRISPRDGDHYSCQATEQGLMSQWSDPFVLRKPHVPTISSAGSHLQVILTCASASRMFQDAESEELVYRWQRDGSTLEGGEMTAGATLNISTAYKGDQYRCQAEEQGLRSDWSDAHVLYEPTIKKLAHNVTSSTDLKPDDVVTFTCEVDGTPPLLVSLIRRSAEGNTALGSTTMYASKTVAFNIGNPSLGEYVCSASNIVGHDDGSTSPGFLKSRLQSQNTEHITLRIYADDDAVATFYLSGYPEPSRTTLSFSPGGLTDIHISNTGKYQLSTSYIEDNWFMVTFTIHNVEDSDEGTYNIFFDNGEGALDVDVELSFSEGEKVVVIAAASVLFVGVTIISIVFLTIRKLTGGKMRESRKRRFNVIGLPDVIREPGSIVTIACRDLHNNDNMKARLPPDIGSDAKRMSFFLHRMYNGNDPNSETSQSNFIASREGDELLLF
ncbi:uncharacterized protein [Haliotis asinina]|uniref:uncharacterized protein n=1 Tax=Haliotis asinina TaxID=109174 RepID=UPI0035324C44